MSIRSEFLEHQEIAVSDIAHTIESYGAEITWESAPYDKAHPMFQVILERLQLTLGANFTKDQMLSRYIPVSSQDEFLEYTWGKPRDIVRFFKAAKSMYPSNVSLQPKEYRAVMRRYSQSAWQDVKAALTAFVPKNSIPMLESALQNITKANFDGSIKFDRSKLAEILKPAFNNMQANGVNYDLNELIKLLYIVGVLLIQYIDAKGQVISHQFHRGNRHPVDKGTFYVHRAVGVAFS